MKRFFSLLLCLLLLSSTCYAAVDFNAEDYSEDELIEIMKAICDANSNLGYLYPNEEILIGTDIPAGLYEFWIEESDISFSQEMIDRDLDYHCQATLLCMVLWGTDNGSEEYDDIGYLEFYFDEYGDHKTVRLKDGQIIATAAISGASYHGVRMKYNPNGKSGLFGNW